MNILLASSEAVPFSKTGGLGDVVTALGRSLARIGHDVTLVLPDYPQLRNSNTVGSYEIRPLRRDITVPVGSSTVTASLLEAVDPASSMRVILVSCPLYFDRPGLYGVSGRDFGDNCERFAFFSRAILEAAHALDITPDVINVNDWQTALVPVLLDASYRQQARFRKTACVMTVHNLAFQGVYPLSAWECTGLSSSYLNYHQLEFYGQLNFLKGGLVFADMLTTVSPTYSREIQTNEYGCGLDPVLRNRADRLVGILNGIDPDEWNPATDQHLSSHFDADNWQTAAGKPKCKRALQEEFGLPTNADQPLFGMISRLTDQKGVDLVLGGWQQLAHESAQLCVLGSGDATYERELQILQQQFPDRVAVKIGFDEGLAHRMEAGVDAFLMPSRFEPCGLNQMYSQRYGTLPIVRAVGGLADTVTDTNPPTLATGSASGFVFEDYSIKAFVETVRRAIATYHNREQWTKVVNTAMRQEVAWTERARQYLQVYQRALACRGLNV